MASRDREWKHRWGAGEGLPLTEKPKKFFIWLPWPALYQLVCVPLKIKNNEMFEILLGIFSRMDDWSNDWIGSGCLERDPKSLSNCPRNLIRLNSPTPPLQGNPAFWVFFFGHSCFTHPHPHFLCLLSPKLFSPLLYPSCPCLQVPLLREVPGWPHEAKARCISNRGLRTY